jgi:very-short-patch-repair endonuclease
MQPNSDDQTKKPKWQTADKDFYSIYKDERDRLKKDMTPAEIKLWKFLKNKDLGIKFRRQHIIDIFIPDFVALSIKLIVEVDGKIHLKQKKHDEERTWSLEHMGYKVIRFTNEEIENDIQRVVEKIKSNVDLLLMKT